jgi:hypothetical protein
MSGSQNKDVVGTVVSGGLIAFLKLGSVKEGVQI